MNRKLTDAQVEAICAAREAGAKYADIAARYAVSAGAIRWRCLANGAELPTGPGQRPAGGMTYQTRSGRTVNRFNADEDALIRALSLQNYRASEIALAMTKRWPDRPRRPHSIRCRLVTLAHWEEVDAGD